MNDKAEQKVVQAIKPFPEQVWETLSRIDVTDHIDTIAATGKRPEISYLSWSAAWMLLKRNFPGSTYSHRPDLHHEDGTVEVEVDVVIQGNGSETQFTNARLGVMDNWFNPITNPTARQVNDSRQRALVKALAFAGLGLNLWGDSMVPVGTLNDPIDLNQIEQLEKLLESTGSDIEKFLRWAGVEKVEDIPVERYPSALRLLESKARNQAAEKAREQS
jgi:hypothetical protein